MDMKSNRSAEGSRRWLFVYACVVLGLAGVGLIAALIATVNRAGLEQGLVQGGWGQQAGVMAGLLVKGLFHMTVVLGLAGGVLLAGARLRLSPRAALGLKLAVVLLLALDLAIVGKRYIETYDAEAIYRPNMLIDFFKSVPEPFRIKLLSRHPLYNYWLDTLFRYYGLQLMDRSAVSRVPFDEERFFQAFRDPVRLWQLCNVRYLLADARTAGGVMQDERFKQLFRPVAGYNVGQQGAGVTVFPPQNRQPPQHVVFEFGAALPRAALFHDWQTIEDNDAALARLADPEFDATAQVVLTPAPEGAALPAPEPGTRFTPVHVAAYKSKRVKVELPLGSKAGVLLFNDKYDAYWRARVDGERAPVWRANYLMRAVPVPANARRVVLTYRPPILFPAISLVITIAVSAWGIAAVVRRVRRARSEG